MQLAVILLLQLIAVTWTAPVVVIGVGILSLGIGFTMFGDGRRRDVFLAIAMALFPPFLLFHHYEIRQVEPELPPVESLADSIEPERYFGPASMERVLGVLQSREPRLGNPEAAGLFDQAPLRPFVSVSLLNLNMSPIVWKGTYFSDHYKDLRPGGVKLTFRDGRLFLTRLHPLPSAEKVDGYLAIEALVLSKQTEENPLSWLCEQRTGNSDFQPVVVEPDLSEFLFELASDLGLEAPPYDLLFIREPDRNLLLDLGALSWSFLLVMAAFWVNKRTRSKYQWVVHAAALGILAWPIPSKLDFLTTFSSYIFGDSVFENLLSSPFHFLLTATHGFMLIKQLVRRLVRDYAAAAVTLALAVGLILVYGPIFLQEANTFSFVHPLEAFTSPGAFVAHVAFLAVFVYAVLLLDQARRLPYIVKALSIAAFSVATLAWTPQQWPAVISFALLWLFKDFNARPTLKAALVTLAFYPYLVLAEQHNEILFIRDNILDEISLMVERNHFRMGRIIQRLSGFEKQLEEGAHDQIMEMFAKQAGLFEDEIDFALRLTDANGRVVSSVDQHIALDRIPYLMGPENRISVFHESEKDPNWLIYRKTFVTDSGSYDFAALLGNDFQNLSLVRRFRRVDVDRSLRGNAPPGPYFAYLVDVYDLEGNPLYNQRAPNFLGPEDRNRVALEPYYWYVDGRNTVFLFKDRGYIYKITHKATPLKMVFVRYLALFLAVTVLLKSALLGMLPGRGFVARWKRSFALKMAGFMFLSSVLPTSTLGFFLIGSIQRNQGREEESLAQSKILAAKNLFREAVVDKGDEPQAGGVQALRAVQAHSQTLGEDLSLYLSGAIDQTNQPEAFRQGVLNRRLSYNLARRLLMGNQAYILNRVPLATGGNLMVAYSVVALDNNREGILAMTMIPFSQRQKYRWREQLEFSVTILFGLMFVMALLTRFFAKSYLKPVSAITRSAARLAKGIDHRPIVINRQDELDRMVMAFNKMQQRIRESKNQTQQQLDILDETLKSMSSGLLGFSQDQCVILQNSKIWEFLSLDPPGPTKLADLVQASPGLNPLVKMLEKEVDGEFSFHSGSADEDKEVLAKLRHVPARSGHDIRAIVVVEDITDAVAASRFKAWSEMARRVAHEIKNPLTPIQLEMDFLTRMFKDGKPGFAEALDDAATQIGKQVQDLRRIATEFSDYARPVNLDRHLANLTAMLEDILEPYRKTMPEMVFETFLEPNLLSTVDERLLKRAIHNLVVNALQAMEEVGRLRLRLFKDADDIHIWVEDTGPGIPVEERRRIFEAYFSTKDHGTGLGMVIAKKYIDQHGGTLGIDPSYDEGTRFQVRLPLHPED